MTGKGVQKVVELEDIGRITFKSTGGKNLRISVHPRNGVEVKVPLHISYKNALAFVQQKKNWIKKQRLKIRNFENGITRFDESTNFRTRERSLLVQTHSRPTISIKVNKEHIHVCYPDFAEINDHRIQVAIRRAIVETWRLEAKKLLPPLVESLAIKYGFIYNKVSIRNNKSRWGSCSKDNNISLNLHLMRLPQHLCEYVILHELAHTIHKNHQQSFWKSLDRLTGNARMLDKELAQYKIDVW